MVKLPKLKTTQHDYFVARKRRAQDLNGNTEIYTKL